VPTEAANITTPLDTTQWKRHLSGHPNSSLVNFFISDISQGFRLGFNRNLTLLKLACRNLSSAEHPAVVEEYLTAELAQSHIAGPFEKAAIPKAHISRFGVIPKKYFSNKW